MKRIFDFLKDLAANNNRDWFAANKKRYAEVKVLIDAAAAAFISDVANVDPEAAVFTPADCTYRIYRDTRFSTDKTPYKTHVGIFVNPPGGKKSMRMGYYLHLEPGASMICGGNIGLPGPVIRKVREDIFENIDEYRGIVESAKFKKLFPDGVGYDFLKTSPKGFPKDWPYIDYLRPRQFGANRMLKDSDLHSLSDIRKLAPALHALKPLMDFYNFSIDPFENPEDTPVD